MSERPTSAARISPGACGRHSYVSVSSTSAIAAVQRGRLDRRAGALDLGQLGHPASLEQPAPVLPHRARGRHGCGAGGRGNRPLPARTVRALLVQVVLLAATVVFWLPVLGTRRLRDAGRAVYLFLAGPLLDLVGVWLVATGDGPAASP